MYSNFFTQRTSSKHTYPEKNKYFYSSLNQKPKIAPTVQLLWPNSFAFNRLCHIKNTSQGSGREMWHKGILKNSCWNDELITASDKNPLSWRLRCSLWFVCFMTKSMNLQYKKQQFSQSTCICAKLLPWLFSK